MAIEGFIKHGPHCLAGKYTAFGRCSCGANQAAYELAQLKKAAQHYVQATGLVWCSKCELWQFKNAEGGCCVCKPPRA